MPPQVNLKNHLLAISVLTLISGLIIFLQFKNINRRIYRLETSMTTLSKELTNYQLSSSQQPNNSLSASQDQQIQQLQNEYQEYQFQSEGNNNENEKEAENVDILESLDDENDEKGEEEGS